MAWPPRDWTDDELVTAAIMNAHLRDVFNALSPNVLSKTGAYTVTSSDGRNVIVLCNATGGAFTITLPPVSGLDGVRICVKKTDASAKEIRVPADQTAQVTESYRD